MEGFTGGENGVVTGTLDSYCHVDLSVFEFDFEDAVSILFAR